MQLAIEAIKLIWVETFVFIIVIAIGMVGSYLTRANTFFSATIVFVLATIGAAFSMLVALAVLQAHRQENSGLLDTLKSPLPGPLEFASALFLGVAVGVVPAVLLGAYLTLSIQRRGRQK